MNSTALPASAPVYDECDRLVMLTPCYGGQQTVLFRDSVQAAMTNAPRADFRCADGSIQNLPILAMAINLPGDSHIDRARNNIIHDFLATPYRHALFCDGDQPFEAQDIALTWVRLMSGVRVLGGAVALKILKTTFACNTIGDTRTPDANGLLPGRDTGTGWMAFKRDVLEEISVRWPQHVRATVAQAAGLSHAAVEPVIQAMARLGYSADMDFVPNPSSPHAGQNVHAFFASGVTFRDGARDWLSEDWLFCHRCRELGIPIKIDPMIRIKHLGAMLYPPPPEDLVAAALQVTGGRTPPFDPELAHAAHQALKALHDDLLDESITVIHPTRGRPQAAVAKFQLWQQRAKDRSGFVYIFAVDDDDEESLKAVRESGANWVRVKGGQGVVAAVNAAASAAKGRILVMAADDCEPPMQWDVAIREALRGQTHLPRVLWTSDGYSDQPVITHPVLTRAFYKQNGWFFCPEYPHLFCDTELTVRAQQAGQIIDARHIVMRHEHPMFTGASPDALHLARNSREAWETGRAIFLRRNPGVAHPHAS